MRASPLGLLVAMVLAVWPMTAAAGQQPPATTAGNTSLSLEEAMQRARDATPEARALAAAELASAERVRQARAGYFPRVDVSESVQRGDNPVFAFSSLLAQRRFTAANFAIAALNYPDAVTNTRTAITIEQPVFDAGLTRLSVRAAELGRDLVRAEREKGGQDLALGAAHTFVRVLQLESEERAAGAAWAAAESDVDRARARRDAGLVTDADVLASEVHLATVRQRQIAVGGDLAVARLQLAAAVGAPLDQPLTLIAPAIATPPPAPTLIADALATRWERRQADLREQLADNARRTAVARYLPTVGLQGGWELNGSTLASQQSSWLVGAEVRLNLFRGFADAARRAEARHLVTQSRAERERIHRSIEVEVRAALAQLESARARQEAGRTALAQARESQRIIRDRYESGLATITDVLRAAEAAIDAESRSTAADMDVILRQVALDRAVGKL